MNKLVHKRIPHTYIISVVLHGVIPKLAHEFLCAMWNYMLVMYHGTRSIYNTNDDINLERTWVVHVLLLLLSICIIYIHLIMSSWPTNDDQNFAFVHWIFERPRCLASHDTWKPYTIHLFDYTHALLHISNRYNITYIIVPHGINCIKRLNKY